VHATAPLQLLGNNEAFIMTVFTNMIRWNIFDWFFF
jgi:hypothetical protein